MKGQPGSDTCAQINKHMSWASINPICALELMIISTLRYGRVYSYPRYLSNGAP